MADITLGVVQTVGKHFVTLSCVQCPPGESPKILVFSGFVIEVSGEWIYITAGHILRNIRAALCAGSTFDIWRLGDQTAGNRFNDTAIPYAFDNEEWLARIFHTPVSGKSFAMTDEWADVPRGRLRKF